MPVIRQETYTTEQPDGTLITTTTKTRTKYVNDMEYGFGFGTVDRNYCCRLNGILRIIEITMGLLIVSLIVSVYGPGPFRGILFGQTFLLIFAGIAFCFSFIFLVVFFFNLHESHLDFWPWRVSDLLFSSISCGIYILMGFIEAYYATGAWSNNCNSIGSDGIIHNHCRMIYEWAFAAFFCFTNGILYAISALLANRDDYSG